MKKMVLLIFVILLPLLMLASTLPLLNQHGAGKLPFSQNRSYRVSQMIEYGMDAGNWVQELKYVYYYNSIHPTQMDSVVVLAYDPTAQTYTPMESFIYTYNGAGRVTNISGFITFPGFGTFELYRLYCIYDGQNRITHYYMYLLDTQTMAQVPAGRVHFVYSGNRLSEMLSWDNMEDKVVEYSKATFTADNQGRAILQMEQTSPDSANWVNSTKDEMTYHPHDTSTGATLVEYMSSMLPSAIVMSSFMFAGMPLQSTESSWSGSAWTLSSRDTYTWNDANDHLQELLMENWSGSAWVPNQRDTYSYDPNGNINLIIEQTWSGRTWTDDYKQEYTWQSTSAIDDPGIPAVNNLQITAYPMPFSSTITISPKSDQAGRIDLSVYNLKGQLVRNFSTLPGQDVIWDGTNASGASCANGVYFIRMEQNHLSKSSRIIKIK